MSESGQYHLLDELAEEFADRFRRGERPSLKEYTDRYPQLANDIRDLFPAMVKVERVKGAREDVSEPPPSGSLPPMARLGDYRIIREVGRGGMGVVYEAEQVSLGRHVALKVLPKQLRVDARTRQRFEREAKAAARLHHTNIVPVFGVGEHEGLPYFVMQFIQGLGLDEVLEELKRLQPVAKEGGGAPRSGGGGPRVTRRDVTAAEMARSLLTGRLLPAADDEPTVPELAADVSTERATGTAAGMVPPASATVVGRLSDSFSLTPSSVVLPGAGSGGPAGKKRPSYWQNVARIGVQVADALRHAHAQGVLHRDIKPSNLLLDTAGVVWVTDFGLAKADDQKNLTDTGDILGTLRYMAPEAFDGRSDARADVYSLGLTLYELLARRPAYDEKDRSRLIKQVTTSEPTRLDRLNPEMPRDLVTIVQKAIERDPAHRYPTASELTADLQRFLDDEPIQARRQKEWERCLRWARRNPGVAAMGAVLTAVLLLVTVISLIVAG
jgi:serine/threonine protein kinase